MSIDDARTDEIDDTVQAVMREGHFSGGQADCIVALARLIARDEIAKLSSAPVGEDAMRPTLEELASGIAIRKIEAADFYAPTPPAATSDGGEAGSAVAIRLASLPYEEIARLEGKVAENGRGEADQHGDSLSVGVGDRIGVNTAGPSALRTGRPSSVPALLRHRALRLASGVESRHVDALNGEPKGLVRVLSLGRGVGTNRLPE